MSKAFFHYFASLTGLLLALLISACAGVRQSAEPVEISAELATTVSEQRNYPARPFPTQTFYDLLVAEFAGNRGQLAVSLDKYVAQANLTRDPGVVARAATVANYLNQQDALLAMSTLWVELEPDNSDARRLALYALANNGDLLTAFTHAEYLLEQEDGEPIRSLAAYGKDASEQMRNSLLERYRRTEAGYTQAKPGKSAVRGDVDLLFGKILLLRQQDQLKEALLEGRRLVTRAPEDEQSAILYTQLLYQDKQLDAAIKFVGTAVQRNPDSKKLRLQQIRLVAETDLTLARQYMSSLAEQHRDDANLQFALAGVNREQGLRAEAIQIYQDMIDHRQRTSDVHFQLALMAEEDQRMEDALIHYNSVRQGRSFLPAAARLTQLLAQQGQLTTAQLYLHNLRDENPEQAVSIYQIEAELLMREHLYDNAFDLLGGALTIYPGNIELLYTRSLTNEKRGDVDGAERDLRAILASDPNNAAALNALGYTLANHTNRHAEAQQLIEQALKLNPNDAATIDSLGWVLYRQGRHQEALQQLRQAMTLFPDAEIAAHLGEVLWVSGNREEAKQVWAKALENDPNDPVLLEALQRLGVEL